jgi:hypothetical protein
VKERLGDRVDSGDKTFRYDSGSNWLCELGTATNPFWAFILSFGKLRNVFMDATG